MKNTNKTQHTFTNPFFVATVIRNADPDYNYRVKVRINNLHDAIEDNDLPWAAKLSGSFMGVDGSDIEHAVPEVGSKVLVLAVANDPNSLIYMGKLCKNENRTPTDGRYLNTYGIYTKDGGFIGVDKIAKVFRMIFNGEINIDNVTTLNINANRTNFTGGPVHIASARTAGFCSLPNCLFTGSIHITDTTR